MPPVLLLQKPCQAEEDTCDTHDVLNLIGYASSPLANRSKESNTLWSTESLRTDSKQSKTKISETIRSTSIYCELT